MRTLVLNAGYEPMQLISWQRAICLVLSQKAEVVAEYASAARTVTKSFNLPSVVRLTRYVRVVRHFGIVRCTRKNVLLRDHYTCQYCGVRCREGAITIDHIHPRARGGRTTWGNVVAACHPCNRRKGSKLLDQTDMKLMRKPVRPGFRELMEETNREHSVAWLPYLDYAG